MIGIGTAEKGRHGVRYLINVPLLNLATANIVSMKYEIE